MTKNELNNNFIKSTRLMETQYITHDNLIGTLIARAVVFSNNHILICNSYQISEMY